MPVHLSDPELLESHARRLACPAGKILSDYRAANLNASTQELRMLATAFQAIKPERELLWAVVVQDPTTFGLFRMLGTFLEAYRILAPGGRVAIIHWRSDIQTPRGPSFKIRPGPEKCQEWAAATGLRFECYELLPCCPWRWGLVLSRPKR